jgi:predicted RNA-binding Zn-ribbon protein involved in translation (DUF1610 family)
MEIKEKKFRFTCPACGADNIGVQTFCLVCKAEYKPAKRDEPVETPGAKRIFCTNCGEAQEPDAKFCASCGEKIT